MIPWKYFFFHSPQNVDFFFQRDVLPLLFSFLDEFKDSVGIIENDKNTIRKLQYQADNEQFFSL